jgi:hypothetical protein
MAKYLPGNHQAFYERKAGRGEKRKALRARGKKVVGMTP